MFTMFKRKPPKPTAPITTGEFPPLPPNHFYRVELRDNPTAVWPLRVCVYDNSTGREKFVTCEVSEDSPEQIAARMQKLSDKLAHKIKAVADATQYCGDYYP